MDSAITPVNIVARRPVWEALSTLFLDTDISLSREYRARILAASPYSLSELDAILADEVFPVCRWNLLAVAGEWAGFGEQWLEQRITKYLSRKLRVHFGFGRRFVHRSDEWSATKQAVEALRAIPGQPNQTLQPPSGSFR